MRSARTLRSKGKNATQGEVWLVSAIKFPQPGGRHAPRTIRKPTNKRPAKVAGEVRSPQNSKHLQLTKGISYGCANGLHRHPPHQRRLPTCSKTKLLLNHKAAASHQSIPPGCNLCAPKPQQIPSRGHQHPRPLARSRIPHCRAEQAPRARPSPGRGNQPSAALAWARRNAMTKPSKIRAKPLTPHLRNPRCRGSARRRSCGTRSPWAPHLRNPRCRGSAR